MTSTPRLELPFIIPGQAQKEMILNESLQRLDLLVHSVVQGGAMDIPPPAAALGCCYMVGTAPTGDWAGRSGAVAGWTDGGWRFVKPFEGLAVSIGGTGQIARYTGGEWQIGIVEAAEVRVDGRKVLSTRTGSIGTPQGGAVTDTESRTAIAAILDSLRHHGLIDG